MLHNGDVFPNVSSNLTLSMEREWVILGGGKGEVAFGLHSMIGTLLGRFSLFFLYRLTSCEVMNLVSLSTQQTKIFLWWVVHAETKQIHLNLTL